MSAVVDDLYYDPFDFEIDADPYPTWRRMRDEQPVYFNEQHDFYALSRWDDVELGLKDHARLSSSKGTLLELLQADIQMPPGMLIFDDPPRHSVYRSLLSRVFTPRKMNAIEPQVRAYCAAMLDELEGLDRFDIVAHLAAQMPMRVVGMLLGIPEGDQQAFRDRSDDGLRLGSAEDRTGMERLSMSSLEGNFGPYLDWRLEHPSDDVITMLLQAEFDDHTGERRTLSRDEVLGYVNLLVGAGNETTTKLIGHTLRTLAEHPDQRCEIVADRGLVPNAIEESLRFEAPSPVQGRFALDDVEYAGQVIPKGSSVLLVNGSANHDERKWGETAEQFDIHRSIDHHLSFGYGAHFCLGAALARLQGRVALDEMVQRFPEWTVDYDESERSHTSTVRGWDKLTLVVE